MSKDNFGFSQKQLREILLDEGTPYIQMPGDGPLLVIKAQGEGHWIGHDTIFYVEEVPAKPEVKKGTALIRAKFNEYFEDVWGWEPDEYPDKTFVEALWEAYQAGVELATDNR